jgi:hypothetical protein
MFQGTAAIQISALVEMAALPVGLIAQHMERESVWSATLASI